MGEKVFGQSSVLIKGDDGISRYMTFRYLFALFSYVVFSILIFIYVNHVENLNSQQSSELSLVHQQRSIVGQIQLESLELAQIDLPASAREKIKHELRSKLVELKQRQIIYPQEDKKQSLPANSAQIYFSDPVRLNSNLTAFLGDSQKLLAISESDVAAQQEQFGHIRDAAAAIIDDLDVIVARYAELQNGNLRVSLHRVKNLILYGCLLLALLLIIFIFRPLVITFVGMHNRLVLADKTKQEFMASISHEIRSPMNGIIGTVENLISSKLTEKQERQAKTILASAELLLDILSDLLGYADIQASNREVEHYPFNLEALTKNLVQMLTERARRKGLELIMHFEPGAPEFVRGDPSKIRQALFHLVSNAIKFTHEGYVIVRVRLATAPEGSPADQTWIQCTVEDTGIGIAESMQEQIFEEFFQVDGSTTRQFSGVGIGLAICKWIITSLGGTLQVRSQVKKGSIFWFEIPLQVDANVLEPVTSLIILKRVKVLIVEDNQVEADLLTEVFQEAGMLTVIASDIGEAVTLIQHAHLNNAPFQLAVVSSAIDHGGAIGFRLRLSVEKAIVNFPLVAITYSESHVSIKDYIEANYLAVLTRPAKSSVLLETLSAVLQAYRQGRKSDMIAIDGNILSRNITPVLLNSESALAMEANILDGCHILLVEDNRINQALVEDILLEYGANVYCAENGMQALDFVKSEQSIDLILMDCMMPVMDGYEATTEIRRYLAEKERRFLPIIAITANALKGDREKCFAAGMDAYLSKPVRKRELITMIETWLPKLSQEEMQTRAAVEKSAVKIPAAIYPAPAHTGAPADKSLAEVEVINKITQAAALATETINIDQETATATVLVGLDKEKQEQQEKPSTNEAPRPLSDEFPLLDTEILQATRQVMKARFDQMLGYYVEDTRQYIDQVKSAIENKMLHDVIIPVHSIKSSSLQMGFVALSHQAKDMENFCRDPSRHGADLFTLLAQNYERLEALHQAGLKLLADFREQKVK